jgi:hypothetical protein
VVGHESGGSEFAQTPRVAVEPPAVVHGVAEFVGPERTVLERAKDADLEVVGYERSNC